MKTKDIVLALGVLLFLMSSCKGKNEPKNDLFPLPSLEWGISYNNLQTEMENKGYVWKSGGKEENDFYAWFVYGKNRGIECCVRSKNGVYNDCVINIKQDIYSYSQVHELLASHFSFIGSEKLLSWELHNENFSNSNTTVNYCEWKESEVNQHVINFWKTN